MARAEAVIQIQYTCGCGFQTALQKEAIEHVESTGHSMTALGMIRAVRAR